MVVPDIAYEHYFKVPVCRDKDFLIRFEEHLAGTFIHCDVFHWNKAVAKRLADVWATIANLHGGPIYALHDISDRKHEKFLRMFGFSLLKPISSLKEIWIWSKNG